MKKKLLIWIVTVSLGISLGSFIKGQVFKGNSKHITYNETAFEEDCAPASLSNNKQLIVKRPISTGKLDWSSHLDRIYQDYFFHRNSFAELLANVELEDFPHLILDERLSEIQRKLLLTKWAKIDGQTAMLYILESSYEDWEKENYIKAVMTGWSFSRPNDALNWVDEMPFKGINYDALRSIIAVNLLPVNFESALFQWKKIQKNSAPHSQIFVEAILKNYGLARADKWLKEQTNPECRLYTASYLAEHLNIDEGLKWARKLPDDMSLAINRNGWLRWSQEAPSRTLKVIIEKIPAIFETSSGNKLFINFLEKNNEAAGSWLIDNYAMLPKSDKYLLLYVKSISKSSPGIARQMSLLIGDDDMRKNALDSISSIGSSEK